jgi:hypothetical protein
MEARTLLLGDWSQPVRDAIDLLRVSYALGIPIVWVMLAECEAALHAVTDDTPVDGTVKSLHSPGTPFN